MSEKERTAKEIARKSWMAAARIYGVAIHEDQVDRLFEIWWKRNSGQTITEAYARN